MNFQKNKTNKKDKQSKTENSMQMPLAPLIQQINQLKTELASMKLKKTPKQIEILPQDRPTSPNGLLFSPKSTLRDDKTHIKQSPRTQSLKQIYVPIREHELRINLQISKLQSVIKTQPFKIVSTLNLLLGHIGVAFEDMINYQQHSNPRCNLNEANDSNFYEQLKIYRELNSELEKQNEQLKSVMGKQIDEIQELETANSQIKIEYEVMARTVMSLEDELQRMKILCDEIGEQREQVEQKLKVYEHSIEKKQSQILMYEDDVNYNRIESQKHKSRKKEVQKMYESLQKQYKQLKNRYENEVEFISRQKNKWKNECENRRCNENDSINFEEQKNFLKRQLQGLRGQNKLLNQELLQTKAKLHDEMKKILANQQKRYKLELQNQKLKKSVQFCRSEMKELGDEVQNLRDESGKYKNMVIKSDAGIKNLGKAQALQQIRQLIQMHKDIEV